MVVFFHNDLSLQKTYFQKLCSSFERGDRILKFFIFIILFYYKIFEQWTGEVLGTIWTPYKVVGIPQSKFFLGFFVLWRLIRAILTACTWSEGSVTGQ